MYTDDIDGNSEQQSHDISSSDFKSNELKIHQNRSDSFEILSDFITTALLIHKMCLMLMKVSLSVTHHLSLRQTYLLTLARYGRNEITGIIEREFLIKRNH